jgi:hypothetical protein
MSVEESKQQWRERALGGYFFGESIANLDRDGLLAVIGCLQQQAEFDRQQWLSERDTWVAISKA